MQIKEMKNKVAKKVIRSIATDIDDEYHNLYIYRWLDEQNIVKCYVAYENGVAKSFALLHACDYDPLNIHSMPYLVDFIYTFPRYRRDRLAYKLVSLIKQHNQITTFCSTEISVSLFRSTGCILTEYDEMPIPTFRYP